MQESRDEIRGLAHAYKKKYVFRVNIRFINILCEREVTRRSRIRFAPALIDDKFP